MKATVLHIILLVLLIPLGGWAQNTLSPTVIGSQGSTASGTSGNTLQYTVGESVILTVTGSSGNILTQGFNQPQSILINNPLYVYFSVMDASCAGISDGAVIIDSISGCDSNYTILFDGTTTFIGDTISDLLAGDHQLDVTSTDGCTLNESIVIGITGEDCDIHFYNAFSPNGDLTNDLWIIDLVEGYPDNTVAIYDRWGVLTWEGTGYDNVNVVWDGKNLKGIDLPDGTYFYIFQSNDLVMKGYVEITR